MLYSPLGFQIFRFERDFEEVGIFWQRSWILLTRDFLQSVGQRVKRLPTCLIIVVIVVTIIFAIILNIIILIIIIIVCIFIMNAIIKWNANQLQFLFSVLRRKLFVSELCFYS